MRRHELTDLRFVSTNAFAWGSADGQTPNPAGIEALLNALGGIFDKGRIYFGSFPSEVRPDSVTLELAAMVRRLAGNDNVVIGAQSGSDRMLERLRRGHDVAQVVRAVEILRNAGFRVYVDFIFALPGEREEDQRLTRVLMRRVSDLGAIVHGHAFLPLPGTPLHRAQPGRVDAENPPAGAGVGRLRPALVALAAAGRTGRPPEPVLPGTIISRIRRQQFNRWS